MAKQGRGQGVGVDKDRIRPAVIVALELDDLAAARVAARQTEGRHRRLGPGIGKPHLVDMGQQGNQHFGHLDLDFQGRGEMGAACRLTRDGFHNLRVGMAKRQGAEGHHPVDVFAAVHVIKPRALAVRHVARRTAKGGWPA